MGHGSSRLLINEQPLQVLPSLAKEIGLDEAIFLQQVHYWLTGSKHEDQGRYWIFNSYEEWHEQLPFFSLRKLERIVTELKRLGLLLVRQTSGFDRKNWYSIDYEAFNRLTKACAIEARTKRRPSRQNGGIDTAKIAASDGAKMAGSDTAKMAASYTESPESPLETPAPRLSPGDFNEADRHRTDTTKYNKKLRAYFHFIVKQKQHRVFYDIQRVRAVLTETVDDEWAERLRQAAGHVTVSGSKASPLFWFTTSRLFVEEAMVQSNGRGRALPMHLRHPDIIIRKVWASPLGDTLHSLID